MRFKVLGLITTVNNENEFEYDLYLVRIYDKTIDINLAVRYINPTTIKSHNRDERAINYINIYWKQILIKLLKYRGYK